MIPCIYDWIGESKDGIAIAYKGKGGVIDTRGKVIAPFIYDIVGNDYGQFSHGLIQVINYIGEKRLTGFINYSGELVIPFSDIEYNSSRFSEVTVDDVKYVYQIATKYIGKSKYETLIGSNGHPLPGFSWKYSDVFIPSEDSGLVGFAVDNKWGCLNIKGEVVIPPTYDSAPYFKNGFACVAKIINGETKYGCINVDGATVIPFEYDNDFSFDNGIALVEKKGHVGLIDLFGNSYFYH